MAQSSPEHITQQPHIYYHLFSTCLCLSGECVCIFAAIAKRLHRLLLRTSSNSCLRRRKLISPVRLPPFPASLFSLADRSCLPSGTAVHCDRCPFFVSPLAPVVQDLQTILRDSSCLHCNLDVVMLIHIRQSQCASHPSRTKRPRLSRRSAKTFAKAPAANLAGATVHGLPTSKITNRGFNPLTRNHHPFSCHAFHNG